METKFDLQEYVSKHPIEVSPMEQMRHTIMFVPIRTPRWKKVIIWANSGTLISDLAVAAFLAIVFLVAFSVAWILGPIIGSLQVTELTDSFLAYLADIGSMVQQVYQLAY